MFFPTGLLAIILDLVSGYALTQSLTSISNIKKYEKRAEKAADWSNTAKARLWDTRYTIGAGFISCLTSLFSGINYSLFVSSGDSVFVAPWRSIWPAILAVALRFGTARYMEKFWATKANVPLLDQYNAAIQQSMEIIGLLDGLSVGWGLMALLKLFGL
ncbi:hypothetical protein N0V82_003155 [Gnomoniopsis sp. IMI 355080]|nr:hypothetical protein N0V82_003155 [Gnomoniopsis sp. IMI 355080]